MLLPGRILLVTIFVEILRKNHKTVESLENDCNQRHPSASRADARNASESLLGMPHPFPVYELFSKKLLNNIAAYSCLMALFLSFAQIINACFPENSSKSEFEARRGFLDSSTRSRFANRCERSLTQQAFAKLVFTRFPEILGGEMSKGKLELAHSEARKVVTP